MKASNIFKNRKCKRYKLNIIVAFNFDKKINMKLFDNYVRSLLTLRMFWVIDKINTSRKQVYEISEIEVLQFIIDNLFNFEEYELFEDDLTNIKLKKTMIFYNLISKKVDYILKTEAGEYIKFHLANSSVIVDISELKFLLYIAYKQNTLSKVKDELEKTLLLED